MYKKRDTNKMTSNCESDFCFVCQRGLASSQGVKGSARLRNSGTLVSDAVGEIVDEEVVFSKLCFRCYRLILGIDYHKRELISLKKTFFKLFYERDIVPSITENTDGSRTDVSDEGSKDECEYSPEPVQPSDHVYYKNVIDNQLENLDFTEGKLEVKCSAPEKIMKSQKLRNLESEENSNIECYIMDKSKCELVGNVSKKIKGLTTDDLEKLPSKRRKIAKKFEDYEYYTEDGSSLDSRWRVNIGKVPSEFESCKLTCTKLKINCNLCKGGFITKKEYISHGCFKRKKKGNISYVCKGCQRMFAVRRDYIKHINLCYKNVPVNCHICLIELPSAAYLPRHMKAFHEGVVVTKKGCLCDQCGRSFSRKEALERHQAQVHGLSHGTHQCPQCGRTFPHTSILAEHLRAHKGYTCTECSKTFSCMSNLTLHKRAHHQKKAMYHCSSCNKHWRFHASYTYHMRKVHGLAQHKCSKCKLLFSAENALERHKEKCVTDGKEETIIRPSDASRNVESEKVGKLYEFHAINKSGDEPARKPGIVVTTASEDKELSSEEFSAHSTSDNGTCNQTSKTNSETLQLLPVELASKCISVLNKKNLQPNIQTVTSDLTRNLEEHQCIVDSKDTIVFVPPGAELKETQVIYQVSTQEPSVSSSGEIVLETLDDLGNDCQYVILVEDGGGDLS